MRGRTPDYIWEQRGRHRPKLGRRMKRGTVRVLKADQQRRQPASDVLQEQKVVAAVAATGLMVFMQQKFQAMRRRFGKA